MADRSKRISAMVLALCFALGGVLLACGLLGDGRFQASGFDQEDAFTLIWHLSGQLNELYNNHVEPVLDEAYKRQGLDPLLSTLLTDAWGDADKANTAMWDTKYRIPRGMKLLAATYALDGPKVKNSQRKALAALSANERQTLMQDALSFALDTTLPIPDAAAELIEPLESDGERAAMAMQVFLICANVDGEPLKSDTVQALKPALRSMENRSTGYIWAVDGRIGFFNQLFASAGKSWALTGIVLMGDALLLALLMRAGHNWKLDVKWLLILLIVDFMSIFQVVPMINLLWQALFPDGQFSLSIIERLYTYSLNLSALTNTLIAAVCTMLLGTLLAFPLAWLVGRTNLYGRRVFRFLFVLTYMVPPYVGAMAWQRLLNPNAGDINLLLRMIFGQGDGTGPLNIYSLPGLIWVLTTFYYPYAFITISRAMEKMDPSLEEASRVSGASPIKTLAKVTLPMMTPSLIAGALLVFVSAASCYGIPSIIGAPGRVHTVTTRIIDYVGRGSEGMNDAIGLGVSLMALAVVVLYISDVVVARRQYVTVSGKSTRPNMVDLGRWRLPVTLVVALFACIVNVVPFGTILTTSFKVDLGKSLLDAGNFTLKHWATVFSYVEVMECLKNSLIFAAVTATVGIVIACVMGYLLQRTRLPGRRIPDFLITLGSGTPSVVIALSLILSMRGSFGISIYKTAWIMIAAYLIKYMMMGMRTVVSAMSQIHPSLEECSQISGASWLKTMTRVTGPLIFPSIAAGWFLIFIPSFYELSMTTLLYGNETKTIGYELYEYWTFTSQPMACALAFAILMLVVALNFILSRLTKGKFSI